MWHNYAILPIPPGVKILLAVLIVWSLAWKGVALWKAARNADKGWFVIILIVNTLGILEIVYIYVFAKKSFESNPPASQTHP